MIAQSLSNQEIADSKPGWYIFLSCWPVTNVHPDVIKANRRV